MNRDQETRGLWARESARYVRQVVLPGVGAEGQARLRDACVFVAGLGGLGSVSALYLTAAGVGRLRIVDHDRVEMSNLNRQLLHWTEDLGRRKSDSALEKLSRLNPEVHIDAFCEKILEENVLDLVEDACIIMDGSDNLETRKVLNRASLKKRIPYIFGGVRGFDGMVTTFVPGATPCLECLFPGPTVPEDPPGIVGPLPGMIASIQALEALKVILGHGGLLAGRLLSIRGSDMSFKELAIARNPSCTACQPERNRDL
jgi:adenylyltransferase/sulfurtransferase